MEDEQDEVLPPRAPAPERPKPLPRMWKAEPEPVEEPPRPPRSRKRRAEGAEVEPEPTKDARPAPGSISKPVRRLPNDPDTPRKGVLLEETPELDTYEARRKIRLVLGLILGGLAVVALLVFVVPLFKGAEYNEEEIPDEGVLASKAVKGKPKEGTGEQEARNLFESARQVAKNGKPDDALKLLKRVVAVYPKTLAAEASRQALERPTKNPPLPLFLDDAKSTVVASNVALRTERPVAPEGPTIEAVDPLTNPGTTASTSDAQIQRPANAEDPNRRANPASSGGQPAGGAKVEVKPLPAGFQGKGEEGIHPSGWPLQIVSDRDGMTMALVPAGAFRMGRDDGPPEEAPAHTVKLASYYVDQHEVTVNQYNLFLKETGQKTVSAATLKSEGDKSEFTDDHPIVGVSAREALAYCEWAGKRLPTEAQWEKAARSVDGRPFPWGSSAPTWIRPRQSKQIDRVMSYELDQSPYGVFDLAGNAWEWTADFYDSRYYQQFRTSVADNPLGPPSRGKATPLTIKGGSKTWLSSAREGLKPEIKYPFVGFRGVLNLGTEGSGTAAPAASPLSPAASPASSKPGRPAASPSGVVPF